MPTCLRYSFATAFLAGFEFEEGVGDHATDRDGDAAGLGPLLEPGMYVGRKRDVESFVFHAKYEVSIVVTAKSDDNTKNKKRFLSQFFS